MCLSSSKLFSRKAFFGGILSKTPRAGAASDPPGDVTDSPSGDGGEKRVRRNRCGRHRSGVAVETIPPSERRRRALVT